MKSAQSRGDKLSLAGLVLIAALFWYSYEFGDKAGLWASGVAVVTLAFVAIPQIFVARRKRRISATRGLNCQHCGYVPHQTEISGVISTRECLRCEKPLG